MMCVSTDGCFVLPKKLRKNLRPKVEILDTPLE